MNLLIVCPHFSPDTAPTGEVMSAICRELAARGHHMDVVTALPWYAKHRIEEGWSHKLVQTEEMEWGRLTRLHPFPTDKSNIPARAIAFGGFTGLAAAVSLAVKTKPDLVLTMSPPLILGFAGWIAARRWRVPFVLNIQDVFPDVAVEVGAITNPTVISVAKAVEKFLYRRSDAVTVLSDDLCDNVATKIGPKRSDRVHVIPNFVDTEFITPLDRMTSYREELGLGDRLCVMYAGNLGYSQSVEMLIDAARRFSGRDDVVFVVNGSGSARASLVSRAEGLENLVFVGLQPKERIPEVLATADVQTVLLKRGLARSSVPSKLYSILASGRPVLASVDPGTEVETTIDAANAGRSVGPDDLDGFSAALEVMLSDAEERVRCGASGRTFVEGWASPAAVAASYEELFESLIAGPASR